jgi:hypothetical protein
MPRQVCSAYFEHYLIKEHSFPVIITPTGLLCFVSLPRCSVITLSQEVHEKVTEQGDAFHRAFKRDA